MKKVRIGVWDLPVVYAKESEKKKSPVKKYSIPDFLVQLPSLSQIRTQYRPRRGSPLRMR